MNASTIITREKRSGSVRRRAGVFAAVGAAATLLLALMPGGSAAQSAVVAPAVVAPAVVAPAVVAPAVVAPADLAGPVGKPNPITPNNLLIVTVASNTNMRSCANTSASCPVIGTASPGQVLHSWCFVVGQTVSGIPWWDVVYNASTGKVGFITEALLNTTAQGSSC